MKILHNGYVYETTEATKNNYLFRYIAEIILRLVQGYANEFEERNYFIKALKTSKIDGKLDEDQLKKNYFYFDKYRFHKAKTSSARVGDDGEYANNQTNPKNKASDKRFQLFLNEYKKTGNIQLPKDIWAISSRGKYKTASVQLRNIISPNTKGLSSLYKEYEATEIKRLIEVYKKNDRFKDNGEVSRELGKSIGMDPLNLSADEIYKKFTSVDRKSNMLDLFINKGTLDLVTARTNSSEQYCIAEVTDECILARVAHGHNGSYTIIIPFFTDSDEVDVVSLNWSNISKLMSTLEHELSHAFDTMMEDSLKVVIGENHTNNEKEEYFSRNTEVRAYLQQMFSQLENYTKNMLRTVSDTKEVLYNDVKSNKKIDPDIYESYAKANNILYYMYYNKGSFIRIATNKLEIYSEDKTLLDFIANAKNNPEVMKVIGESLGNYYDDLKSRYANVLPTKKYQEK